MADIIVNLDFIPVNVDGQPVMKLTLAKEVGRLLCEGKDTEYCFEKYKYGKELFNTGEVNFGDDASPQVLGLVTYFKQFCNQYSGFTNEIKGQILNQFP